MKYCTNCGNKLGENASVCLKCGKIFNNNNNNVNKKKGLPVWAIVLIVLGAIFLIPIIFAILGYVLFSKSYKAYDFDDDYDYYDEEYVEDYGTIGDTLDTGSLSFTLSNYILYSEMDEIDGDTYDKVYLILYFDVKNYSNRSMKISNYDFVGYADYEYVTAINEKLKYADHEYLAGKIEPGETVSGCIVFLVDEDWDEFEVSYNNYYDNEITFWLENDYKDV